MAPNSGEPSSLKRGDLLIKVRDKASGAYEYRRSFLIICEGNADANFIAELLAHHGIDAFDVHYAKGNMDFRNYLETALDMASFARIKGVVIVSDNESCPPDSFLRVQQAFESGGFPVPTAHLPTIGNSGEMRTGIIMLPGVGIPGAFENLLYDAATDVIPEIDRCITSYADCAGIPGAWESSRIGKMKLASLIAVKLDDDPNLSLSYIWSYNSNPVPIASGRFKFIVDHLICFIS